MGKTKRNPTKIQRLVHSIIKEHEHIHEFRLQRITYLCELIWYIENNKKLSNEEYKLFKGGVYSSELQEILETMEKNDLIDSMTDKRNNSKTKIYVDREENSEEIEMENNLERIMDNVLEVVSEIQSEDLVKWSKNTVTEHEINYGEPIDFKNFDVDSLRSKLKEDFPGLYFSDN